MIVPDVPQTPSEITRFIEQTYHVRHREELPQLAALAAKVEHVHADSPDVPAGLADLLAPHDRGTRSSHEKRRADPFSSDPEWRRAGN